MIPLYFHLFKQNQCTGWLWRWGQGCSRIHSSGAADAFWNVDTLASLQCKRQRKSVGLFRA